jgi:hypothetical protein
MSNSGTIHPYLYPTAPHVRRHGPSGYSDYQSYRPWLEDEFSFRCVYCLKRMVWSPSDVWVIDHLISQVESPELECVYDNLVFACGHCNSQKGPNRVPDPCEIAYGTCIRVEADGTITSHNRQGNRLIQVLRLNHSHLVAERLKTMRIHAILSDPKYANEYQQYMGFPTVLPDLASRKPPGGNSRPQGLNDSHLARRQRDELPTIY